MAIYPNVDAVKAALDGGATYSGGKLVIGGVPHFLLLQDGAWTPDPAVGVIIFNRTHFDRMKASPVIDAGDFKNCFATPAPANEQQLASVTENGVTKAKLIDP